MLNQLQLNLRKLVQRKSSVTRIEVVKQGNNKMSVWSTIEADVTKGLEVAAVVTGVFEPSEVTLIEDIAEAWGDVVSIFTKPVSQVPPATVSSVTQAAVTMSAVKQAAAAKDATASFKIAKA
jgi:dsDNA-binding SOS-regulon protein